MFDSQHYRNPEPEPSFNGRLTNLLWETTGYRIPRAEPSQWEFLLGLFTSSGMDESSIAGLNDLSLGLRLGAVIVDGLEALPNSENGNDNDYASRRTLLLKLGLGAFPIIGHSAQVAVVSALDDNRFQTKEILGTVDGGVFSRIEGQLLIATAAARKGQALRSLVRDMSRDNAGDFTSRILCLSSDDLAEFVNLAIEANERRSEPMSRAQERRLATLLRIVDVLDNGPSPVLGAIDREILTLWSSEIYSCLASRRNSSAVHSAVIVLLLDTLRTFGARTEDEEQRGKFCACANEWIGIGNGKICRAVFKLLGRLIPDIECGLEVTFEDLHRSPWRRSLSQVQRQLKNPATALFALDFMLSVVGDTPQIGSDLTKACLLQATEFLASPNNLSNGPDRAALLKLFRAHCEKSGYVLRCMAAHLLERLNKENRSAVTPFIEICAELLPAWEAEPFQLAMNSRK